MMKLTPGDKVRVIKGDFVGLEGTYLEYVFERYMVQTDNGKIACKGGEIKLVQVQEPEEDSVLDMPVHRFPISEEALTDHLEFLLSRALDQVGVVGPEQALFGFQEFEGKTPTEVLVELMLKIEEGMALFAQVHILIGRIVLALEQVNDSNT
jgi:ribosomal protein L24